MPNRTTFKTSWKLFVQTFSTQLIQIKYSLWCKIVATLFNHQHLTEFRQPIQVQSHLEMPGILVQLGRIQRTSKLAPQTDHKWSPTWILRRYQTLCPLSARDGRYINRISRAHRSHSHPKVIFPSGTQISASRPTHVG